MGYNNYYNKNPNDTANDIIRTNSYNKNISVTSNVSIPKKVKYNPGVLGISSVANAGIGAMTSLGTGIAFGNPVLGVLGMIPAAMLGNFIYESANKRAIEKLNKD